MATFESLIKIIVSPRKTFSGLKNKPYIILPLILILISSFVFSVINASISRETQTKQIEDELKNLEGNNDSSLDAESAEQVIKIMNSPIGLIFSGVWGTITKFFSLIFSSLFFYLLCSLFGGNGQFKNSFSVILYAQIPLLLRSIIQSVYMVSTDKIISPGLSFMVEESQIVASSILSFFDIFTFWNIFLLILGFSIVFNISKVKSLMITGVYFLLVIIFSIAGGVLGTGMEDISKGT